MAEFVYVLMNASIPGQLKIGRTARDVEERARELSAHTGVPTPFVVAFTCEVGNSVLVESEIHKRLQSLGYRTSSNREFFAVPLKNAIEVIQRVIAETPFAHEVVQPYENSNPVDDEEGRILRAISAVDHLFIAMKSEKKTSLSEVMEACNLVHEVSELLPDLCSSKVSQRTQELLSRNSFTDFFNLYDELLDNSSEVARSVYTKFETCALHAHER